MEHLNVRKNIVVPNLFWGGGGNSRPGRIDYVYEMNGIGIEGKKFIANKILHDIENSKEEIENLLNNDKSETPAQFKESCINLALEKYMENQIIL